MQTKCGFDLKTIGDALNVYASENQNEYPPKLDLLLDTGVITENTLICPTSGDTLGKVSYIYVPPMNMDQCLKNPRQIVAYEPPANHNHNGGNVLFCDGSVMFVKAGDWVSIMNRGGIKNPPPIQ